MSLDRKMPASFMYLGSSPEMQSHSSVISIAKFKNTFLLILERMPYAYSAFFSAKIFDSSRQLILIPSDLQQAMHSPHPIQMFVLIKA